MSGRLHPDDVRAIAEQTADLLADRLGGRAAAGLVDAKTLAEAIGMSVDYVRDHRHELGGRAMGTGPRPRWRFDLAKARVAFAEMNSEKSDRPSKPTRRRSRKRPGEGRDLLPIRGEEAA